ncbi:MAG: type 1 glutamine amidotransferase domain-containing protein [Bdellovibrionia bacterium]
MKLNQKRLAKRKIAVLVADGFEMAEYMVPVNALRMAGADVTVVSLRSGRIRGVNLHEPAHKIRADLTVDQANEADYDALFVPGGFINPDLLRQSAQVRGFVSDFERSKKPIATLCHGPWVLASAGLSSGRTLTSWPGTRDDMVNAGATWLDQAVVRDGNWVTSRGPQDFADFVPAMIDLFTRSTFAPENLGDNERAVSSPQRDEPPSVVLSAFKWMPRPSLRGFALGLLVGGLTIASRRVASRQAQSRNEAQRDDFAIAV